MTGPSAQPSERKEASQAAVRILGAWERVATEMYGNRLININVHCRDALWIKSYGQSFLDLADALQLKKDYSVPFVGIGARDTPGGHVLVCFETGAGMHLVCNEELAVPGSKRPFNRIICGAGGTFKAVKEVERTSSYSASTAAAHTNITSRPL